jgi:hypothetical protein
MWTTIIQINNVENTERYLVLDENENVVYDTFDKDDYIAFYNENLNKFLDPSLTQNGDDAS